MPLSLKKALSAAVDLRKYTPERTTVDAVVQQAIRRWLDQAAGLPTAEDIDFTCKFCRAEYRIPPVNPIQAEVVKAPIQEPATAEHPQVSPEAQWMVDEFVRLLQDPEEKHTVEFLSAHFARRRRDRGESA